MNDPRVPKLNDPVGLTAYSHEHLTYEIDMLIALANSVIPEQSNENESQWVRRMASIESFGLHLRNLIEFFNPSPPKNTDVIAKDFSSSSQIYLPTELEKSDLENTRKRVSRELAHLTTYRQSGTSATKHWKLYLLNDLRKPLSEFAKNADSDRLSEKTRGAIDQFMKLPIFSKEEVLNNEEINHDTLGSSGPSQRDRG